MQNLMTGLHLGRRQEVFTPLTNFRPLDKHPPLNFNQKLKLKFQIYQQLTNTDLYIIAPLLSLNLI